jgi:hypothetical protein
MGLLQAIAEPGHEDLIRRRLSRLAGMSGAAGMSTIDLFHRAREHASAADVSAALDAHTKPGKAKDTKAQEVKKTGKVKAKKVSPTKGSSASAMAARTLRLEKDVWELVRDSPRESRAPEQQERIEGFDTIAMSLRADALPKGYHVGQSVDPHELMALALTGRPDPGGLLPLDPAAARAKALATSVAIDPRLDGPARILRTAGMDASLSHEGLNRRCAREKAHAMGGARPPIEEFASMDTSAQVGLLLGLPPGDLEKMRAGAKVAAQGGGR